MIQLIINADDFGLSPEVNDAIVDLFEMGIVTRTSALACSQYLEDGIHKLGEKYYNRVGLHICLDEEKPVANTSEIHSLIDEQTGNFKKRKKFVVDSFLGKISARHLYIEIEAQFNKLISLGIHPGHIDSHGHLHLLPNVAGVVASLAKRYNICLVRRPKESFITGLTNLRKAKRLPLVLMISFASEIAFRSQYNPYCSSEAFIGLLDSGHLNLPCLVKLVEKMRSMGNCSIELMCHPGKQIDMISNRYMHWQYNWDGEYRSLIRLNAYLQSKHDIILVSFAETRTV